MTSNSETANLCGLNRKDFQTTINGKKTDLYILRNRKGYEVAISNYGGAICAIMVPDKDGNVANVVQGFDSIKSLMETNEIYAPLSSDAMATVSARVSSPLTARSTNWLSTMVLTIFTEVTRAIT